MKISSTYTVALQLLMICKHYEKEKITSGFISRKIGADSAIIRRVMADLKSNGYIESTVRYTAEILCFADYLYC